MDKKFTENRKSWQKMDESWRKMKYMNVQEISIFCDFMFWHKMWSHFHCKLQEPSMANITLIQPKRVGVSLSGRWSFNALYPLRRFWKNWRKFMIYSKDGAVTLISSIDTLLRIYSGNTISYWKSMRSKRSWSMQRYSDWFPLDFEANFWFFQIAFSLHILSIEIRILSLFFPPK